jgi:hypothetical protein
MPLSRARDFHGNYEGSITTYDHVNSDGSQSVHGIQSLTRATNCNRMQSQNRRKPTDDVGRMQGGGTQKLPQKIKIVETY